MDLSSYRRRLGHSSAMEAMNAVTKQQTNATFRDSPNFKEVFLNGILTDARVSVEQDETQKQILFRPDTKIYKGDVIDYGGTHWLVNNTYDNDLFPTAFVDFCNEWLRWINAENKMFIYPCVVRGQNFDLQDGKYLVYSENIVEIWCPYNTDTKTIVPTMRFILNGKSYEIKGVDAISNVAFGKGFIHMKATETQMESDDNLNDEIADNRDEGWGSW